MIYLFLLMVLGCPCISAVDKLNILKEWKYVDFVWENQSDRDTAINSGKYNSTSCIPYDVDRAKDGRIFVTVVRGAGVPATLATVNDSEGPGGPLLKPYPSWSWNQLADEVDCRKIIGVYRVAIYRNRLYVLDTGNNGTQQICSAKLLIFNLENDEVVTEVLIPHQYSQNKNGTGLLVTPVVDGFGSHVNVYMADTEGYGLVVWDGKKVRRLESDAFEPESDATHFVIGNDSFDLADGLLGMAIATDERYGFRPSLYFRPLASFSMYHVNLRELRSLRKNRGDIGLVREPYTMRSQSAAQAFSRNGILFFSSLTDRSLICWNRHKTFNNKNTVQFAVNHETLQFPSGMKVVFSGGRDILLVMTNRYQQVANNDMDFNDVNFRIHSQHVDNIVKNTNCE